MAFNPLDLVRAANKKIEEGAKTVVTDLKKGKEATTYKTLQNIVNVAKKQDEVKAQQAVRQAQIDESLRKAGVKPSTISAMPTAPLDTLLTRTAQNAQSYPELTGYLPQKRDNVADLDSVSNIISGIYNTIKKPIISGASNILGMSNPLLKYTGVGKKLHGMAEGALKETIENPAQNLKDRLSAIYQKQDARQNTNLGDRVNDTMAMGTALTGTVLSGLPVSAAYNAAVGALRGNKETENIAKVADVTTQAIPSFIAGQVNKIEGISPEAKDALSMLANVGLVGLGSKVGKGIQKRIDSPAYTSSFSNAFADAIKQNRNVFSSGLNVDPIIKAVVAGEKALVKNPIVQALDPTGITTGASNVIDAQNKGMNTQVQDALLEEAKKYKSVEDFKKNLNTRYHQTSQEIESIIKKDGFRIDKRMSGKNDPLPIGVNTKMKDNKIMIPRDGAQMKVYFKKDAIIKEFNTRDDVEKYFMRENSRFNDLMKQDKENSIKFKKQIEDNEIAMSLIKNKNNIDKYIKNEEDIINKWEYETNKIYSEAQKESTKTALEKGWDAISINSDTGGFGKITDNTIILNPEILKTENNIIEIYNKAHKNIINNTVQNKFDELLPKQPLEQKAEKTGQLIYNSGINKKLVDKLVNSFLPVNRKETKAEKTGQLIYKSGINKNTVNKLFNSIIENTKKDVFDKNRNRIIDEYSSIITKDNINKRIDNFVTKVAGYDTSKYDTYTPKVGTLGKAVDVINAPVNALSNLLRKGEQKVGTALEKGLSSKQPVIRYASATMQNLFRDMAKSPELETQTNKFRGALNTANQHPADVMDSIYNIIDNSAASKSRIFDLLDPELARDKNIKYDDLSPKEKVAYNMIKEGNDLIHDISYSMGKISPELYEKNKGKYSARTYTTFELPEEMQKAVNESTKKMIDSVYKQRGKVDNWKIENALRDPVYNLGKRMSQVFQSKAVDDYANYLAKNSNVVSDVERPGFVKLEGKGYGALQDKYVQKQIAEEFKGFFYTNEVLNKAYDVFKAYDKLGIRQAQKKALTMYNPATNINNITSDVVFSFLAGVDPLSLHKNVAKVLSNKKEMNEISNYLMKQGASGADMVRSEFYKKVGDVEGVRDKNTPKTSLLDKVISKGKKIDETVSGIYSGADDVYKAAAFKTLVEYGNTPERAAQLVRDGFQNYNKVGKLFDVYSKTPVIGSAFTKFTGNLMSIIKSGMVNRPLNTIGFVYALKMIGDITSKWSGETEEERKLREERLGAPQISIPGVGNIPLAWNTPYGEVNIARMIAPAFTNVELDKKQATIGDYAEKFLPYGNLLSGDVGQLPQDPLLGPIARLYMDKDFRGKNISDPNQSKYNPSTATEKEKLMNKLRFLQRSYTPPVGNTAEDTIQNLLGKQDYYGKERTPTQALLRTLGIKVEQFGKEQVQKQIDMQKKSDEFKVTDTKKAITDIFNEYTDKKINLSTEKKDARLRALQEENPTFDVYGYYKEIEAKKLNEKASKPKTASQKLSAIKAEKRAEKLTEQKQKQATQNIDEVKTIVKNATSIDEARKQIKNKYKTLSDEAIEKLIIYSLK